MTSTFRPLTGIKVFDVSHVIAGPFATLHLALLGAEVTKIESPHGDMMRSSAKGKAAFVALNGLKRSVRLDLASAPDRERGLAMAREADVLVDNLRPGALEKLGFGYEAIAALNPRIIYCSISGFGRTAVGVPAYDHVIQCATGMSLATGETGNAPTKIGFPLIDTTAGLLGAYAILAALRERDRTGKGCLLDVSMTGAALQLMYPAACAAMTDGEAPSRTGNRASSGNPAADVFATRDGIWIATAPNKIDQMRRMFAVLGLSELVDDPKLFAAAPAGGGGFARALDPATVNEIVRARIAEWDADVLLDALTAASVPVTRVNTLPEFITEAESAGLVERTTLSDDGVDVQSPGLGFRVSQAIGL